MTATDRPEPVPEALTELARAKGVDTWYRAADGTVRPVPGSTLVRVLAALGVDAPTPERARTVLEAHRREQAARPLPPYVIAREGRPVQLDPAPDTPLVVDLEDGGSRDIPAGQPLPADLPLGYHTLRAATPDGWASAPLIVAPARVPAPERRGWGFAAQLYAVLSDDSWGMGDLGDLETLVRWSGRTLGADFTLINPLHAMLPAAHADHSPYWPSSRFFPDPVHLRVDALPEYPALTGADRATVRELADRAEKLRSRVLDGAALIDRDAVWELKRAALQLLHRIPPTPERLCSYRDFTAREGRTLTDFATARAFAEAHGPDWRTWPAELRHPASPAVAEERQRLAGEVEFHRWLAWLVDGRLADVQTAAEDAGMAIGVVHDLAVGVHPGGAEAWALQDCLATGVAAGAPPDAFSAQGQNWQIPPWRPDALARTGYAPYAALLRRVFRHAGAVRLDHVMGLFRLWWIPEGSAVAEGTYVRYDREAMLGVLALEALRAGVSVIGEDLGTVESGVRDELAARGVLGTSVLWLTRETAPFGAEDPGGAIVPAHRWRRQCLATLTTHDLPSTASWLSGDHVEPRHRHGLLPGTLTEERKAADEWRGAWLDEVTRAGCATGDDPDTQLTDLHRYLARTPALLLAAWLPDVVGDLRSPNLPGTSDEHPNWQLPVADATGRPVTLARLSTAPLARAVADALTGGPR
ncbi:4-alpha-glucanotransferase [Streptomyces murinus]|uniref:4-alpha-glucanotransferase n=1 Tax=Streptomyces murinus TaxID=33900 RepID=UPI000A241579|nr:4-alpha-glucanotransferase [Streptomyces murinus]WDO05349.1 4-alpha-glucanotransferase [Streptomyces murinus]